MRSLFATFVLVTSLCAAPVNTEVVQIAPGLSLDTTGEDTTFQELPEAGAEKRLCLWSGDFLLAVLLGDHEVYDKDLKSFLAHSQRGIESEGAKGFKMSDAVVIKNTRGADIRRYDIRYKIEDNELSRSATS
jgi:hypothetical protein